MNAESSELERLLVLVGAKRPEPDSSGKWQCPICLHWSVVVHPEVGFYTCFRRGCRFFGKTQSLKKEVEHGASQRLAQ